MAATIKSGEITMKGAALNKPSAGKKRAYSGIGYVASRARYFSYV